MTTGQIVAYVIVPFAIFLLGGAGAGTLALIRFVSWLAASRAAQEATAKSNQEIADTLKEFMSDTNGKLTKHGEELAVHSQRLHVVERAAGIDG